MPTEEQTFDTTRLYLRGYKPMDLLALIEGYQQFENSFGLPAAEGLRDFFVSDEVSPAWIEQLRKANAASIWGHGFAVIDKASNSVIGTVGFKGPPDDANTVEIAYGIVPSFQDQGYATEAAIAAITFAFTEGQVKLIRAHTLPTSNASCGVLKKCGFNRVGEVIDPDDGLVWRWELDVADQTIA